MRSRSHVSSSKFFTFRPSALTSFGEGGRRAAFGSAGEAALDGRKRPLRIGPGPPAEAAGEVDEAEDLAEALEEEGSPTTRSKICLSPNRRAFCAIIQCSAVGKYTSRASPSLAASSSSPSPCRAGSTTRTVKGEGYHWPAQPFGPSGFQKKTKSSGVLVIVVVVVWRLGRERFESGRRRDMIREQHMQRPCFEHPRGVITSQSVSDADVLDMHSLDDLLVRSRTWCSE